MKQFETTGLKVSDNTAGLIGCAMAMYALNKQLFEALRKLYGDDTAERIMDDEFADHIDSLNDAIDKYTAASIRQNIGFKGSDEI